MKKIVLAIIALLCLASCEISHEPYTDSNGVGHEYVGGGMEKITIDGHEYLKFTEAVYCGSSVAVVHSASCPANHENWNKP